MAAAREPDPKPSRRPRKDRKLVEGTRPGEGRRAEKKAVGVEPISIEEIAAIVGGLVGGDAERVTLPPSEGRYSDPRAPLHPRLKAKLLELGLNRLYAHQAQAFDLAMKGHDLVVVTSTGSGKTLCSLLPVLETCLSEPAAKAIMLFPTKALAHDQLFKIERFLPGPDLRAGAYDGDTSANARTAIRKAAHILLTNPEMLHMAILPQHETWARFLRDLRYVVIDELHVYRGVFGSHFAGVIRRLLRLCEWYGSRPQFITTSGTLANPTSIFNHLTGRSAEVIFDDGAPTGGRTVFMAAAKAVPRSPHYGDGPNAATAVVLASLLGRGARALAFCRSRGSVELVLRSTRRMLDDAGWAPNIAESYRAGYTPKERRDIARGFSAGKIRGLVTTNAMELGIDVGDLDAVILNGYPGSAASFWQQLGRAGRAGAPAVGVYLAHEDPMEHLLARRPELLIGEPFEFATLNPENSSIMGAQIRCAAYERPVSASELEAFGSGALALAEDMECAGELHFSAQRFFWPSHDPPAPQISLRGTPGKTVGLFEGTTEVGQMEFWRALCEAHPSAVYLHRDRTFIVESLDLDDGHAILREAKPEYHTQAIVHASVTPTYDLSSFSTPGLRIRHCAIEIARTVTGFRRLSFDGDIPFDEQPLEMPTLKMNGFAARVDIDWLKGDVSNELPAAIHAVEHALLSVAPLLVGCEPQDLGSCWFTFAPDTFAPSIFVYDQVPGGVGLADMLVDARHDWIEAAASVLESCLCLRGCPACLLSPRCPAGNQHLDKFGAMSLLIEMKGRLDAKE